MYLSRDQVRDLDRRAIEEIGIPGAVLMENAGRGAAEVLLRLGAQREVVICAGKGNNGGDGFVLARHLDNHGVRCRVILLGSPQRLAGDAAVNYHVLERSGLPITIHDEVPVRDSALMQELASAQWIVDGLFGTGLAGSLRPPFDRVVELINQSRAQVLALDIPSGLDCDSGLPQGPTVRAHHTVTFVAPKQGFAQPAALAWLGQVHVVDIGAPRCLLDRYRTASQQD
jgi:NAD(P)H-hydrate epimerase